jgi:excisionase family DNA binding protein
MNKNDRPTKSESGAGELESPEFETKAQLARRLSISTRTVENLMRSGKLPFVRLTSKLVRFPRKSVDAYVQRHLLVQGRAFHPGGATE